MTMQHLKLSEYHAEKASHAFPGKRKPSMSRFSEQVLSHISSLTQPYHSLYSFLHNPPVVVEVATSAVVLMLASFIEVVTGSLGLSLGDLLGLLLGDSLGLSLGNSLGASLRGVDNGVGGRVSSGMGSGVGSGVPPAGVVGGV